MTLDTAMASRLAHLALGHVTREYPHKLVHVVAGPEDVLSPRRLHPIFFGSFDWHSCVHSWWLLLTVRRLFPNLPVCRRIEALADDMLTPENVAGEREYLLRPHNDGFERPYGWAWLLYLHLEATRHEDRAWGGHLEPLARVFADLFHAYIARLTYAIRVGTHSNTAFALTLGLEWSDRFDQSLATTMRLWAVEQFRGHRDCQAWEPAGDEFLSPALMESLCMTRVLIPRGFTEWFSAFLPRLEQRQPVTLFLPATVSDRRDGQIVHLDGLNLSRAWCWRSLAPLLSPETEGIAIAAARDHLETALDHIAGDYVGEHWIPTFALLALLAGSNDGDPDQLRPRR